MLNVVLTLRHITTEFIIVTHHNSVKCLAEDCELKNKITYHCYWYTTILNYYLWQCFIGIKATLTQPANEFWYTYMQPYPTRHHSFSF